MPAGRAVKPETVLGMASTPTVPTVGMPAGAVQVCQSGPAAAVAVAALAPGEATGAGSASWSTVATPTREPTVGLSPYSAFTPSTDVAISTRDPSTAPTLRRTVERRQFITASPSAAQHPTTQARVDQPSAGPNTSATPSTSHNASAPIRAPPTMPAAASAGHRVVRRASSKITITAARAKAV